MTSVNFKDPDLILMKRYRGGKCSYYQVSAANHDEVTIKDIEHGGHFAFPITQLKAHIKRGVLVIMSKSTLPDAVFVNPVNKKAKPKLKESERDKQNREVMERRYTYVRAVLDSHVPAYTQKRLDPWLEEYSARVCDDHPPSWRTLAEWVSIYVKSGWKRDALIPRHANKGKRGTTLDELVVKLLDRVVREHTLNNLRINYTKAHNDFLERVEKLNQSRAKQGLPPVKPGSYRTTVNRFQK